MKRIAGREMKNLILAVTLMTMALVIGVIAYFMVDVILTSNRNIEENKQLVVEQSIMTMKDVGEKVSDLSTDSAFLEIFDKELIGKILQGDMEVLYDLTLNFALGVNPLAYVGLVVDGELVRYEVAPGVEPQDSDLATLPPQGEFLVLESFGGKQGTFVSLLYPIDLSAFGIEPFYLNMVMDRTAQMQDIEGFFVQQRNRLILRMSAVSAIAVLLTLLITTFGLRYFTGKYVMEPVRKLNRMAEEIADGVFAGEVEVDKESAYAALQGLLRSGQLILRKMGKEMEQ